MFQALFYNNKGITTTIMKLLKNVKSIVEKCDFFCPTEFFRYKKEP